MSRLNGRLSKLEDQVNGVGRDVRPSYVAVQSVDELSTLDLPPGTRVKVYIGFSPDDWPDNEVTNGQNG